MFKHPNIEKIIDKLDNHIDSDCEYSIFGFKHSYNFNRYHFDNLKILLYNLTGIDVNNSYTERQVRNLIVAYIGCLEESKNVSWLQINATDEYTNYVLEHGLQGCVFTEPKSAPFTAPQRQTSTVHSNTQGSVKAPKNGACALIWEVANRLWDGCKNIDQLDQIKKDARVELVAQGINTSTISVQLSKWGKFIQNN